MLFRFPIGPRELMLWKARASHDGAPPWVGATWTTRMRSVAGDSKCSMRDSWRLLECECDLSACPFSEVPRFDSDSAEARDTALSVGDADGVRMLVCESGENSPGRTAARVRANYRPSCRPTLNYRPRRAGARAISGQSCSVRPSRAARVGRRPTLQL